MPKRILVVLPLLVSLLGCDRQPNAPSETPALNWMNNPEGGSLRITRFESSPEFDEWIVCWSDAANGLRACHATIPLGGDTPDADCGPQGVLDPIQIQWVGLIDEVNLFNSWIHQNAKGVLWITVRDLNQPGVCFGNKLIAEGWGSFHNNDNDLFGFPGGANAWRFAGEGRLTTPTGRKVSYNGHINFRFNESAGFKELSAVVSVH